MMGICARAAFCAFFLLLTGCVIAPYESAFSACDAEAGACYRSCEEFADTPEYGVCHADCEAEIQLCFDDAYAPYRYSAYGASYYSYPWYGRYGAWYPRSGYFFSFDYFYSDYYGRPYRGDRRRRYDRQGRKRADGDEGAAIAPQPKARPGMRPRTQPRARPTMRPQARPKPPPRTAPQSAPQSQPQQPPSAPSTPTAPSAAPPSRPNAPPLRSAPSNSDAPPSRPR